MTAEEFNRALAEFDAEIQAYIRQMAFDFVLAVDAEIMALPTEPEPAGKQDHESEAGRQPA